MSANSLVFPLNQIGENLAVNFGVEEAPDVASRRLGAAACLSRHDVKTAWTSKTLDDYGLIETNDHLMGQLKLSRTTNSTVRVSGLLKLQPQLECARCLKQFRLAVDVPVDAFFMPRETHAAKSEVELSENDFGAYEYQKDQINLEELLVDCIETSVPDNALCDDDCKGLCIECGRDLNEAGHCDHNL